MYKVVTAPSIADELIEYAESCSLQYGELCSARFIKAYENAVASLSVMPQRGFQKTEYISENYRIIPLWNHLWLVYQVNDHTQTVHIEYLIEDRSDYGTLIV